MKTIILAVVDGTLEFNYYASVILKGWYYEIILVGNRILFAIIIPF